MKVYCLLIVSESEDDIEISFSDTPTKDKADPLQDETGGNNDSLTPVKLTKCFEKNNQSIGELWLGLLKFYSAQYDVENLVSWFFALYFFLRLVCVCECVCVSV